jgi:hypothetical protein
MGHLTRLSAPWTDSRPHPRITNQLAGGHRYNANQKTVVLRQRGEGAAIARCQEPFMTKVPAELLWELLNYGRHIVNSP